MKSMLLGTFAAALMLVPPSESQAVELGNENITVGEQLEKWDGAQAFLAVVDLAVPQCARFKRLLRREKESLVVLVPTNEAIADWLRLDPKTFDGLTTGAIVDAWPEITIGRDVEPRDLCRLLRRHFSRSGAQTVQELLDRGFITMVNGDEIPVAIGRGGVVFGGKAPATVRDVATLNAIIHFLEQSLAQDSPPPSSEVVRVFQYSPKILGGANWRT
jgi:hypothetical protein